MIYYFMININAMIYDIFLDDFFFFYHNFHLNTYG